MNTSLASHTSAHEYTHIEREREREREREERERDQIDDR